MKKIIILFLYCLLWVGTINAQSGEPFSWEIREDVLYIHGNGAMPDYVESFVDGYYTCDAPWFEMNNTFSKVEINEGITNIGDNSFFLCYNLVSVSIPSTVTSIGESAFAACTNLLSIEIPTSVTHIGARAFYTCFTLSSVIIPNSVEHIGIEAFSECTSLNSVTLPATLPSIGSCTFLYCFNLTEIINTSSLPQLVDLSCFAFSNEILETCTLRVPAGSIDTYNNSAGWELFENIEPLSVGITITKKEIFLTTGATATIPILVSGDATDPAVFIWTSSNSAVATVDNNGIITAISLGQAEITLVIGENQETCLVTVSNHSGTIGTLTWEFVDGTLTIRGEGVMPDNSEEADVPWYDLKNEIISVIIDNEVTAIGSWAFTYCSSLTSVDLPNSLLSIGEKSFMGCHNLTSVVIPNLVRSIGDWAFLDCFKLTSVFIPNSVISIGDNVFRDCSFTFIDIPNSVTSIGNHAFASCVNLVAISIPSSVTFIGNYAFIGCTDLISVELSNSITSIGEGTFLDCSSLTSIVIPNSVSSIGDFAFAGCTNLSEIINLNPEPQDVYISTFSNNTLSSCILRVPEASVNSYEITEVWKEFAMITTLDAGLFLEAEEIYMLCDATIMLKTTINGDVTDPAILSWETSDMDVATVNPNGIITAVSPGMAVITVSIGALQAACTVTVIEPGTSSIEGTVNHTGTETVTVNLYIKLSDPEGEISLMKVGGYILLAKTTTNANGQYSFDDLPPGDYLIDVEIEDFESDYSPEITLSYNEVRSGVNFTVNADTKEITPEITTGTEELLGVIMKIYPNPFTEQIQIEGAEGCTLRIFAIDGRQVHIQTVTVAGEAIHLEHLPAGIYIIRMEKDGRTSVDKAVKQ